MTSENSQPTDRDDLARLLGMNEDRLTQLAGEAEKLYERFPLKTRRRRPRWIEAPKPFLKLVQRRLLDRLLYEVPPTALLMVSIPSFPLSRMPKPMFTRIG